MKKSVYVVVMLIFLSIASALSTISIISTILTFTGSSEQSFPVSLPGNAYVLNTTLTFNGELSEWETESSYTSLNSPQDAEYVSSGEWLITDTANNRVILLNPNTQTITQSYSSVSAPEDAEYIDTTTLLIADTGNDRIILIENLTTTPAIGKQYNYSSPDPIFVDADYLAPDKLLITDRANKMVRLVNFTTGEDIAKYSTSPFTPYDAEYIDDDEWLIARSTRVLKVNLTDNSTIDSFDLGLDVFDIESIDNDTKWLVTVTNEVRLVNTTDKSTLQSYTDNLTSAKDAEYNSDTEWLITDETGTKKVSLVKRYYPTNLTLNINNDSDFEWNYTGEFNTTVTLNDANMTDELNDYLETLPDDNTTHSIPFVFHSDTSGVLNITDFNLTYNQKPNVTVTYPNGGEYLAGNQTVTWTMNDDDNDSLSILVEYFNGANWTNLITVTDIYATTWDTSLDVDDQAYLIRVSVNDSYNNASDTSDANFTIDNTQPNLTITMGDIFFRNTGITVTANATDNFGVNNVTANITCNDTNSIMLLNYTSGISYTGTWNTPITATPGNCTVDVIATDMAGNTFSNNTTIQLKLSLGLNISLSNTNPASGSVVTVSGYVTYDDGSAYNDSLVNITYPGGSDNITTNTSGYYELNFTATAAGTVTAYVYENDETFSNSSSFTIAAVSGSSGGGGGGGGGSNNLGSCGNGICAANENTISCPADCSPDDNPLGALTTHFEEEQAEDDNNQDNGILENATEQDNATIDEPQDNPAVGSAWAFFTNLLKKPLTLAGFLAVVAILTTLLLLRKGGKKKKSDFLKEFGDV